MDLNLVSMSSVGLKNTLKSIFLSKHKHIIVHIAISVKI